MIPLSIFNATRWRGTATFKLCLLAVLAIAALLAWSGGGAPASLLHRPNAPTSNSIDNATTASTNWSGYATYQAAGPFTDAKGAWTQPAATCPDRRAAYASFWVGLDGYNSNTVEQIGTDSDCAGKGRPVYYAWYEMYPNPPVSVPVTVHPGDQMYAEVSASGSTYTLTLTNLTTGATFTTQQTLAGAANSSAEWVAEAPSGCRGFRCTVLPLANFGTVNFSGSYTTASGHTGSISDSNWANDRIIMVTNGGTIKALPSALSPDGTAFSDTWNHQ